MLKHWALLAFILLVATSHALLPYFNNGKDFFVLATWRIFANNGSVPVVDLVFENSSDFLFRDQLILAKRNGIETYLLYALTAYGSNEEIKQKFGKQLESFCNCSKIYRVRFKGTLSEHIYEKKHLEEISREQL